MPNDTLDVIILSNPADIELNGSHSYGVFEIHLISQQDQDRYPLADRAVIQAGDGRTPPSAQAGDSCRLTGRFQSDKAFRFHRMERIPAPSPPDRTNPGKPGGIARNPTNPRKKDTMTNDAPRSVLGPTSLGSPEAAYELATTARRTIQAYPHGSPALLADIAAVAAELLHNAADHAHPKDARAWSGHIHLRHLPDSDRFILQVSDSGPGINATLYGADSPYADHEAVDRATEAGTTSSGDPDRGQGLHQVRTIAQVPGRTLTISSRDGFFMVHAQDKIEVGLAPRYPGTTVHRHLPAGRSPRLTATRP